MLKSSKAPYGALFHALQPIAAEQVRKAVAGEKLASIEYEGHPDVVRIAPTTNQEAYLLATYWLGVASRIAQARGLESSALTQGAVAAMAGAGAAGMPWWLNPAAWFGWSGSSVGGIQNILLDAAEAAESAGVPEAGAEFRGLAREGAIAKRQEEEEKASPWSLLTPPWMQSPYFKWGAIGAGALLLLGLATWAFRPYAQAAAAWGPRTRRARWNKRPHRGR